jgi:predicted O-methyltransferase YrrM
MTALNILRSRFDVSLDAVSPVVLKQAGRAEMSRWLADCCCRRGAEIGVWRGKWSARLCADNLDLELLCVDRWSTYGEYADSRNDQAKLDEAYQNAVAVLAGRRATLLRMASLDAAATVPDGSLDFVYIDANHGDAFVTADLEAWVPKVRRGGVVSGHDYIWRAERPHIEVKAAVDRFVKARGISPLFVFAADVVPSFAWVVE